jgi:NAD(P)-dependent dehydrogenase (short-subunit alcohol dehydrogenase family)
MNDVLGYSGKRCIVTGAASGMGAATAVILAALGAEVHAVDIKPPDVVGLASTSVCDLREPHEIAATVRRIGGIVNNLFNCAGLPNDFPPLDVMLVNWCGLRTITEAVIPLMVEGAAIASIASVAGMAWQGNQELLRDLLAQPDFAAARAWCEAHPEPLANAYGLSKEAINMYTASRAIELCELGIRMNCLNPGPTDTPMMPHFEDANGRDFMRNFPKPIGRNSTPDEQAWPLVFLGSPRASYVTGASLFADGGFTGALFTGQIDFNLLMPPGMQPG